jgi:hypothetical protein
MILILEQQQKIGQIQIIVQLLVGKPYLHDIFVGFAFPRILNHLYFIHVNCDRMSRGKPHAKDVNMNFTHIQDFQLTSFYLCP